MHRDFIQLYDDYFDDVYRYIYFKTGSRWDADDLTGDVFRKAYEKFHTLRGNSKAWLFTITRNTVTDYYRKKKDISAIEDMDLLTYPYIFEENLEKKEEINCLKKSLKALSQEDLEIVNLKYFSEMKYGEIGKLLDKSEDSVKMKASRIIKKLKLLVKKCMEV